MNYEAISATLFLCRPRCRPFFLVLVEVVVVVCLSLRLGSHEFTIPILPAECHHMVDWSKIVTQRNPKQIARKMKLLINKLKWNTAYFVFVYLTWTNGKVERQLYGSMRHAGSWISVWFSIFRWYNCKCIWFRCGFPYNLIEGREVNNFI